MGINSYWTFETSHPKTVIWVLVTLLNCDLIDAAFNANAYVSLVKSIVKYPNIRDCWICGQADDLNSPLFGVPVSNWMEINLYELFNTSYSCRTGNSSLEQVTFRLVSVNHSVQYIGYNISGVSLGQFNGTKEGNWTEIALVKGVIRDFKVTYTKTASVNEQMWAGYLYGRSTNNVLQAINATCDLPDGYWWLCGDLRAWKQLPRNWTGECTMGYLVPPLQMFHKDNMRGIIGGIWRKLISELSLILWLVTVLDIIVLLELCSLP